MLTILKPGIYTTVQDNGRFFGAHLGIPISGPMDRQGAEMANLMLQNDISDAVLECTYLGPTIQFHAATTISINGAEVEIFKNEVEIIQDQLIRIGVNDIISFGRIKSGCRFYLAIKGGFQSKIIFNSQSTCHSAGILRPLKKGDQLAYLPYLNTNLNTISMRRPLGNNILLISKGPEFGILTEAQQDNLFKADYSISPMSNRMAYRVKHSLDLTHSFSMVSSGTLPGTVQLTPAGDLIILMRDTQTTGGYPRILQLREESICDLSQLAPNTEFSFRMDGRN